MTPPRDSRLSTQRDSARFGMQASTRKKGRRIILRGERLEDRSATSSLADAFDGYVSACSAGFLTGFWTPDELMAELSVDEFGASRSRRGGRDATPLPLSLRGRTESPASLGDILPSLSPSRAFHLAATTANDFASRYPSFEAPASPGLFAALSEGLSPQLLTADISGLVSLLAANRMPTFSASGPAAQALPPVAQASGGGGGGGGGGQAVSSPLSPTQQIAGGPHLDVPENYAAPGFNTGFASFAEGEGENHAPVAVADSFNSLHDESIVGSNVLANDYDFDADPITAVLESGPTSAASFTLYSNGNFIYTSLPGWTGTDSFSYRASDGIATSAAAVVQIQVTNEAPTAFPIPAVYRGAQETAPRVIDLFPYFADVDDADDQLVYSVVQNTNAGLVTSTVVNGGDLTMNFAFDTGGIANLTIRATDRVGELVEATFSVYNVRVTGILVEHQLPDNSWAAVPDGGVLWVADDHLRWTAQFSPQPPNLQGIEWLMTPAPAVDYPDSPWTIFAQSSDASPAEGDLTFGHWAITPRLVYPNAFAMLQAPVEKAVVKLISLNWKQHNFNDGFTSYVAGGNPGPSGGDAYFAERRGITLVDDASPVHDLIDVEVEIARPEGFFGPVTYYLLPFDPDHESSDADEDPLIDGKHENDNVLPGGDPESSQVIFGAGALTFQPDQTKNATFFEFGGRQPGNNYIVVGRPRPEYLDPIVFAPNGKTLLKKAGGEDLPQYCQTKLLTMWRTLWVEEESMQAPDPPDPADPDNPETKFDGPAEGGNDDFDPGDLGGATGVGNFVQPSLALLTSELQRAHVKVVKVDAPLVDTRHEAPFVHNLPPASVNYGEDVRDVFSQLDRWAVEVFAAYEWDDERDFDPNTGIGVVGLTLRDAPGPVNIFLETLRDMSVNFVRTVDGVEHHTVDAERLRQRAVLHEVMHRFGHRAHDVGVMDSESEGLPAVWFGSDEDIKLNGTMLREIMIRNKP